MKKRIFALSMALVLLFTSVLFLASCADQNEEDNKGTTTSDLDHLNGLDFGGMDINFIIAEADGDDFHYRSIYVDEDMADDAVNTALYERNQRVQNLLNINIVVGDDAHADRNIKGWIGAQLQAGIDDYDVIAARQYDDIQLALDGVILDLKTLDMFGDAAKYLNWDREYWATSYIDALSFGDRVFWLTGDLCLRYTGGFYAMFVNSRLYNDLLEQNYGSIYQIVKDGDWTYDKLIEMVEQCYEDSNGDDKVDIQDRLGLLYPVWDNTNGLAISAGVVFTRYEDGVPRNNVTAGNKALINFMNKCNELLNTKGVYSFNPPSPNYVESMQYFAEGRSVFVAGRLNQAELYLRDMPDDYFVVPCPKIDANQDAYYTGVHDAINIYGINHNIDDDHIEAVAATLEAMAYYSYKDVRPVYYESFLKFKYTRDDIASQMIDIMHDGVYTDFVFIWQFAEDMHDLGFFLRNNVARSNPTSSIKKNVSSWDKGLEAILDRIQTMELD